MLNQIPPSNEPTPDFSDLRSLPEEEPESITDRLRSDPRIWIAAAGGVLIFALLVVVVGVLAFGSRRTPAQNTSAAVITVRVVPTVTATLTPIPTQALAVTNTQVVVLSGTVVSTAESSNVPTSAGQPSGRLASLSDIKGTVQVKANPSANWTTVTAPLNIAPGATVLTSENSSVKITFSEGTIVRLNSQTQFTISDMSGDASNPVTTTNLDFGKVFTIVTKALGAGKFEIKLPVGVAAVRGSYMSAETNSTDNIEIVTCLEGLCSYTNRNGTANLITNQFTQSIRGGRPDAPKPLTQNQLNDWNTTRVPEVVTLTPTVTPTFTRTNTFTPTFSRTPAPTRTASNTPPPSNTPTLTQTYTATPVPPTNTPVPPTLTSMPAGTPSKLAIVIVPSTATAGTLFTVKVEVRDANGIKVPGASNAITMGILAGPGTFSNAPIFLNLSALNGEAIFDKLTINVAGNYTFTATSSGPPALTSGTSPSVTTIVGASATTLSVLVQPPTGVISGTTFSMQFEAKDAFNNIAPTYNSSVIVGVSPPDPLASFTPLTFSGGGITMTGTLRTLGVHNITITDSVTSSLNVTTNSVNVTP